MKKETNQKKSQILWFIFLWLAGFIGLTIFAYLTRHLLIFVGLSS